jgi:hypothetical protein
MHVYVLEITAKRLAYHAFLTQKSPGQYLDGLLEGNLQLSLPNSGEQPSVGSPSAMDVVPPGLVDQVLRQNSTESSQPSTELKGEPTQSTPTESNP